MKTWQIFLIAGITALVLIALGGFLIKQYGDARYDAGKATCTATQATVAVHETTKAVKAREKVEHETAGMSDDAIDADLLNLGIMRGANDR